MERFQLFKAKTSTYRRPLRQAALVAMTTAALSISTLASAKSVEELESMLADGQYSAVEDVLSKVEKKSFEQYNLLISALVNTDLDDAEDMADAFVKEYANDYRSYHTHAMVMGAQASDSLFSALGYAKKAKQSLEKAVEIAPDKFETYQALMMFHIAAPGIAGGDMEEALELSEKIAKLDRVEGQFAKVNYLRANDQMDEAFQILSQLSEQNDQAVRALYQKGNLHIGMESYDDAISTYEQLQTIALVPVAKDSADQDARDSYVQKRFSQLYGLYRIGWVALESKSHSDKGIKALKDYLVAVDNADISVKDLPSKNWTLLRLSGLYLQDNQVKSAQEAFAKIGKEQDDRFNDLYKSLEKAIKKRA